jgi:hypothetical protein
MVAAADGRVNAQDQSRIDSSQDAPQGLTARAILTWAHKTSRFTRIPRTGFFHGHSANPQGQATRIDSSQDAPQGLTARAIQTQALASPAATGARCTDSGHDRLTNAPDRRTEGGSSGMPGSRF